MMGKYEKVLFPVILLALTLVPVSSLASSLPTVRIGMLTDGHRNWDIPIDTVFIKEIKDLFKGDFIVRFPKEKRLEADWTIQGVTAAMNRLYNDPEVDVVLALGVLASNEAGRRKYLPKLTLAPFVINAKVQEIPFENGASGKKNLSYTSFPSNMIRDIRVFQRIVPFSNLAFFSTKGINDAIPGLRENIVKEIKELGISVSVIPIESSAQEALLALPPETQAVYLVPQTQLSPVEFKRLVNGLIERKLPSFSLMGKSEVKKGIMASLALDTGLILKLARRTALNLQQALLGGNPATFPVTISREERLTINMGTARAIGVSPGWDILTQAEVLHGNAQEPLRVLSLSKVAKEAVRENLDVAAADSAVRAGKQVVSETRSTLLPQADIATAALVVDDDRAAASMGSQAEKTWTGSLGFSQLIYSEPAWSRYYIENKNQEARKEESRRVRLDVALEAVKNYLNVLNALTVERIQQDNLNLSRTNLELARTRRAIGVAGPTEVLRWESAISTSQRDVINAYVQSRQAKIVLNRSLHRPLEEDFSTEEPALDDPALASSFSQIFSYVDNPISFKIFRDFMVKEGLGASPELKQLDESIAARERSLVSSRRAFWTPKVLLNATVTRTFSEEGAGAGGLDNMFKGIGLSSLNLPEADDTDWEIAVQASIPLFTSGARKAAKAKAQEELNRLLITRQATEERIAAKIRTALYQAGASYSNIEQARNAAESAKKNLGLISDSYAKGAVSILDLLDAQNAALIAGLQAASSVYDYLVNLMDVQRSVGQFDFFLSEDGKRKWMEKLNEFFREHENGNISETGKG